MSQVQNTCSEEPASYRLLGAGVTASYRLLGAGVTASCIIPATRRFFSSVNEEVLFQISCLAQRAATVKFLLTTVGETMLGKLCPRVSFQVSSDTACQNKFIVSLVANECFLKSSE